MKKSLLLLTLAAAPAFAGMGWNDCCDFDCNFSIGAQAIYWKPCAKEYVWGSTSVNTDGVDNRKNLAITPNYDWGFRIFGTVSDQCEENTLMLRWAYLNTSDNGSKKGDFTFYTFSGGEPSSVAAFAKERYRYHNVQLRGIHDFCKQCDSRFYGYAGLRYVYIRDKRQAASASDATTALFEESIGKFSGGGIEAGFGADIGLWCDVRLVLEGGIAGLVGTRDFDVVSGSITLGSAPDFDKTVYSSSRTICMPGLDAKLGLAWGSACWCFTYELEVGYQVEYYFSTLLAPTPVTPQTTGGAVSNVGFAGPYFGITLGY